MALFTPNPLTVIDASGQRYSLQFAPNQSSQGLSYSPDTSVPLFKLYLQTAENRDSKRLELLKGDTDQILVFVSPCVGISLPHRRLILKL